MSVPYAGVGMHETYGTFVLRISQPAIVSADILIQRIPYQEQCSITSHHAGRLVSWSPSTGEALGIGADKQGQPVCLSTFRRLHQFSDEKRSRVTCVRHSSQMCTTMPINICHVRAEP